MRNRNQIFNKLLITLYYNNAEVKMKYYLILFLGLTTLIGCGGSGKIVVEEMSRDNSFNSNDFLNGKISIYSP